MRIVVRLAAGLLVLGVVLGVVSYAAVRVPALVERLPAAVREALVRLPWGRAVLEEREKPGEYVPGEPKVRIGAKAEELTPEQVAVLYEYYRLTGNLVAAERDLVSPSIRDLDRADWKETLLRSGEKNGVRDVWEPLYLWVPSKCLEPDVLGRIWVVVEVKAKVTFSRDRQAEEGHRGAVVAGWRLKFFLVQRDGVWYVTAPLDGIEVARGWIARWID